MQVWHLHLPPAAQLRHALSNVLSPAEQVRAQRMRPGQARDEFITGRTLLRCLLAVHLACTSAAVPLLLDAHRKPCLQATPPIFFNIAHSHGLVLIALSLDGPLGIDLEYRAPTFTAAEALELARTSFSAAERQQLQQASEHWQAATFYDLWTAKEALAKADGRGLLLPLDQIPTPSAPDSENSLTLGGKTFFLKRLQHLADFAAALAHTLPGQLATLLDAHDLVQSVMLLTLPRGDRTADASGIVQHASPP